MATHQQTQAPSDSPARADEKSQTSEGRAVVFWDTQHHKIPDGLNAGEVLKNIKTYLAEMGHRGEVSIRAYADKTNPIKDDVFNSVGIEVKRIPEGEVVTYILRDMVLWAVGNADRSSTLMVISSSFYYNHTIKNFKQANLNVLWKSLSAEGKPVPHHQTGRVCQCVCMIDDAEAADADVTFN